MRVEERRDSKRKERLDKGSVRVTERDLRVLRWIGEQYAVRIDQLAQLLAARRDEPLSESAVRAVASQWSKAGLASSKKIIATEPRFIWLTRRGLDEVGLEFKPWTPAAVSLSHLYWTSQVRLHVETRHPEAQWTSERKLRSGQAMQTMDGRGHVVDAEVHLGGATVGVEVELSAKSVARRRSIMSDVAAKYVTVWYFAPANIEGLLRTTSECLPQAIRDKVRIYPLERVA